MKLPEDAAKRDRLLMWGLVALALVLRAAYVLNIDLPPYNDAARWNDARLAILHGLKYDVSWPPLYPALLALVTKLTWEGFKVLYLFNSLVSALTGVFVFLTAREAFGRRAAWLSLALWAVYADLIWYSGVLMGETLGVFLFSAFIYSVVKDRHPAFSGFLLGLACMAKGLFILSAPALAYWYWVRYRGGHWIKKTALLGAFTFLTLLPWNIRNSIFYKDVVPLEPTLGCTIFDGHNPYASGGVDYAYAQYDYGKFYLDPAIPPVEKDRICMRKSIEFIVQNPLAEIPLTLKKISKQLTLATSFVFYREQFPARKAMYALALLQNAVLFPLCALGIIFTLKDRNGAGFSALIFIFVGLFVTAFTAEVRKRMPFIPLLLALAAHGALLLPGLIEQVKRGEAGPVKGKLIAAASVTAFLYLNFVYQVATRYKDVLSRFN